MATRSAFLRIVTGAFAALSLAAFGFAGSAFAADARLKANPSVESADIRLGDLFDGAGDAGSAVFGMAPAPGRTMSYSASYVQAKAKQSGLVWSNPENISTVTITRGGAAAVQKTAQANDAFGPAQTPRAPGAAADLKRGDSVQIIYRAPGIELIVAGKATSDAEVGGKARAVNLRSNKAVDGMLVSPTRIEAYSLAGVQPTQIASLEDGQ